MVSLEFTFPAIYEKLFTENVSFLEHAPVDCRANEVAIAYALLQAEKGKYVAVIGNEIRQSEYWLHGIAKRQRIGKHFCYRMEHGELWFVEYQSDMEMPAPRFDVIVILGVHQFDLDPSRKLRRRASFSTPVLFVGERAGKNHWSQMAKGHRLQIDAPLAFSIWPDIADQGQGLKETDPYYERKMLLLDVEPKFTRQRFLTFARNRLKIRTDKPLELLSEAQQEIAASQFGTPIVPFDKTLLQRRYLARKRLAIKNGKKPWFILVKYRRGGFTTTEQGISYQTAVTRPNSQVVTLADTQAKATRIFRMVGIMADNDHEAPKREGDSRTQLQWENGSLFFIGTAGSKSFARGDTIQRAHGSEAAFWCPGPHQTELVNDIKAGIIGAASHGEIVWESTPNRRNWFYQDYKDAVNGESEFTPIFVRWFDDPLGCGETNDAASLRL